MMMQAQHAMSTFKVTPLLWGMILLFLFAKPTHAFGAGNIASISKVEGQNCKPPLPNDDLANADQSAVQGAMEISRTPS